MPLSRARDRERKRQAKLRLEFFAFQPKVDALQSKSTGIETVLNSRLPTQIDRTKGEL